MGPKFLIEEKMKKLLYLLSVLVLFCGCEKNDEVDLSIKDEPIVKEEVSESTLPNILYASAGEGDQNSQTRTFVEGKKVYWHNGDEILFCADMYKGARYKFEGEDGIASAEFTKVANGNQQEEQVPFSLGVFPYDNRNNDNRISIGHDGETWTVTPEYKQQQIYAPNSFDKSANIMIAAGKDATDNNLYFRNACGYIVIKLYGLNVKVKSLWLVAQDENVRMMGKKYAIKVNSNGEFTFEDAPKVNYPEPWRHVVFLDCGKEGVKIGQDSAHATEFWFALPPMTIKGGIRVRVEDTSGTIIMKETTNDVVVPLNKVQPMAAFDVTSPLRSNRLWYKTATTDRNISLDKFNNRDEWNSQKYFNANIIDHHWDTHNPNDHKMFYIEFDRPLTEIKKDAFKEAGITEVILPDALETIGESAFEGNEGLTSVTLQSYVTTVGKKAFYNNPNLEVVNLSERLTSIGESAFQDTGVTSLEIPGNVTRIDQNAFANCEKLASVIFEPSEMGTLMSIGMGAFQHTGLTSLNIPRKVVGVEQEAFADCEKLASVIIEQCGTPLTIGAESTSVSGNHPFYGSNNITSFSLDRELVKAHDKVSMNLFENHTKLTNVTLDEQVKTIYSNMFYNTGITSITIPGSVTRIEENAFSDCANLATVSFKPSITDTPLTIDVQSKYLDYTPFYDSNNITTLNINRELVKANDYMPMALFRNHSKLANVNIGEQMETIYDEMFYNCTGLKSITIPGNVKTIGSSAFAYCSYLEKVTINEGQRKERIIGNRAFFQCYRLNSITLDGITSIGERAFYNCNKLTSIRIPGSVNFIDNNVFDDCTSLKSVTFAGGEGSLVMGYIIEELFTGKRDQGPFYDSPLTEINLNRTIVMTDEYKKVLDDYDEGIFSYNDYDNSSHRTTLTVGDQVKEILPWMFAGSGITSVNIPASVTAVGYNAFLYCGKLSDVIIEDSSKPLTFGYQYWRSAEYGPFYDSPLTSITLKRDINYVDINGASFNPNQDDEGVFSNKHRKPTKLSLDGGLRNILPYMFSYTGVGATVVNGQITAISGSVWIPHTIESIGSYAFYDCDLLAGLTMGYDGTTVLPSIGSGVFYYSEYFRYIKVRKTQLQKFKDSPKWDVYESKLTTSNDFQ